jgi:hypothetical protein
LLLWLPVYDILKIAAYQAHEEISRRSRRPVSDDSQAKEVTSLLRYTTSARHSRLSKTNLPKNPNPIEEYAETPEFPQVKSDDETVVSSHQPTR